MSRGFTPKKSPAAMSQRTGRGSVASFTNFPRDASRRRGLRSLKLLAALGVIAFAVLVGRNSDSLLPVAWAQNAPSERDLGEDAFGTDFVEPSGKEAVPVDLAEDRPSRNGTAPTPAPTAVPEEGADADEINQEATTALNVRDVDLAALVKSFSKILNRNYIVDSSGLKGGKPVTIHLPTPVSLKEAMQIFESVLLLRGFTTVPVSGNTWKVIAAKDARQTTIPTIHDGKESSDALVTQLVRLRYVKAPELQQTLSQFVSRDGLLTASPSSNALIIIDSSANIQRMIDLANELDVPAIDQDITIIPIKHADAKDVAEKVNDILGSKEDANAQQSARFFRTIGLPPRPGVNTPPNTNPAAAPATNDRPSLPLKVIPDERTNSVIAVADPETTLKIRALVEQLDSQVDRSGGRFFVYRLKHADAEELAEILSAVISGSGSTGGSSKSGSTGSSLSRSNSRSGSGFGSNSRRTSFGDRSRSNDMTDRTPATQPRSPSLVTGEGGAVNFEGEVSIAADGKTNSLIINSSRGDYLRIKQVIDELDVRRRQVLVEATILEVSLTEDQGLGVEFQATGANENGGVIAQTNYGGLTNLLTNPSKLNDLTIAAASTGTLTLPGGITIPSQALLISAVSSNSNVNVLSAPNVLTTDNEEAEIVVGENVPFVTSTSTSDTNLNNTFNQIERQDVGITLRITPQIGVGSYVALKIFVEISNVVPSTRNDSNGPTTNVRTTETSVEVMNGQMIVTGGLISDSMTESTRGVPFWQEIPVLGNLFRRDDDNRRRTNLLIFITPKIVGDQYDAREATIEHRDDLEKVIHEQQADPDRHEVLHSDGIDRVSENFDGDLPIPSTITPPPNHKLSDEEAAALQRTHQTLKALAATPGTPPPDHPSPRASGKDDVMELRVRPKLPGSSESAARPAAATKREEAFVLLRGKSADDRIGLVLPRAASQHFNVGARYHEQSKGKAPAGDYICIGKYSSMDEAARVYPELARRDAWKSLSPSEVASLPESWVQ